MKNKSLLFGGLLLVVVAVLAAMYWPHLMWKVAFAASSSEIKPLPTKKMTVPPPKEPFSICKLGPVEFSVPTALAGDVSFRRGIGGLVVILGDTNRRVTISMPEAESFVLHSTIVDRPEKSQLTFSRLHKEILEASSSDFSFGMSRDELAWHGWLMAQRAMFPGEIEGLEYLFRDHIDGHFMVLGEAIAYQWTTTDFKWEGTMYFSDAESGATVADWMRVTCASFAIDGDPSVLTKLDEEEARTMLTISSSPHEHQNQ
jgi:hypothetical protein